MVGDVDYLKLQKENSRLEELVRINQRLHSSLDVDEVLSTIVDVASRALDAQRSTLYVLDHDKGEIWSRIVQGEGMFEIRLKIGEGIAGHVAETGETVRIADAHEDSRFDSNVDAESGFRTRSMLCMPLEKSDGERVGVIQVMNKKDGEKDALFTDDDEHYLHALGIQAALSLQNAQYTSRLQMLSEQNSKLVEILEQRLRDLQSLKMVSMKHMARGIAHEVNNMLAKVKGGAESLEQTVEDLKVMLGEVAEGEEVDTEELDYLVQEGLPCSLDGILEGTTGIAEIVKRIRGFVRLDQGPVQFSNINEDVETVIKVCANDAEEAEVTVEVDLSELPGVECRSREINMVLRELLRNAIYYASEGKDAGELKSVLVKTRASDDQGYISASFLDNGPGIPQDAWEHIFDLFFTTKPEGSGYGLGLSECYSVATRNGGTLFVEEMAEEEASRYKTKITLRLPTKNPI
ncbi:GAF domain-containing sensor histidine kinase [bacterium]|nr:GAF domain-containing sensor histidine kinase [bacterium]